MNLVQSLLNISAYSQAYREVTSLIIRYRRLVLEMARREITDLYLGQVFGILWMFGHPLLLMAVYIFLFRFVFKVQVTDPDANPHLDYATYILAGLIPWLAFLDTLAKSPSIIRAATNLVKQVIFPIEVLPVKTVVTSLVTLGVFLIALILYCVISSLFLPWTYLLLPLLIILQALAMIGVAFFLSALGVYFRDLKDFIQAFSVVSVYLMPIFYLPSAIPAAFRPLIYLNPFSYLIWCYQDVLYYGHLAHWWALIIFAAWALLSFVVGYRVFRKLKIMFGNVL